ERYAPVIYKIGNWFSPAFGDAKKRPLHKKRALEYRLHREPRVNKSLADIAACLSNVRFSPESRHRLSASRYVPKADQVQCCKKIAIRSPRPRVHGEVATSPQS